MLRRIGSRTPKIFGIMDLTQGYHQAHLSDTTKTFITFSGVYEFTRLPFGPKRAPSNFQEIMAREFKKSRIQRVPFRYSRMISNRVT